MGKGNAGGPERTDYAPKSTLWDDLQVLKAMWFGNISGGSHQDQLESFYNKQAHLYDQYRHRMLHGRRPLMMNMPVEKVRHVSRFRVVSRYAPTR